MKISVLDRGTLGKDTPMDILYNFGEVVLYENTAPNETIPHIADSDIIIVNKMKITRDVMTACKKLKLVCVFATGYDNIDVMAAKDLGVAVCNVPGYSTDSVALFTITTALSLYSHLLEYRNFVNEGEYLKLGLANRLIPVYHELKGKTWGIVGCGNIGSAVAKVAEAFGAKVIVYKRTPSDKFNCVDIDTLCKESDIITVHCPLNDGTRNLINKDKIDLMKKSVVIVNEARGAVVNEYDVAEAIKQNLIGGFGADVYTSEPFDEKHPFWEIKDCDNVILTPHAAWGAYEARERCINIISDNISSFLSGGKNNRVD